MVDILRNKKKRIDIRCIEHEQDSIKGDLDLSDATEHTKECHKQFNWIHPRTIAVMPNTYKRNVREALGVNRLKH